MDFSGIHNYYEHLVTDYIHTTVIPNMPDKSADFFLDVACYALSRLPARYMRHEIDMVFYLEESVRADMVEEAHKAVDVAVDYIKVNFNKNERYE